jgi:hypothetical protein
LLLVVLLGFGLRRDEQLGGVIPGTPFDYY